MTDAPVRPDGHAFTTWLTAPEGGFRDVQPIEVDYLRWRAQQFLCPFCRRESVDLVRVPCVCGERVLSLQCQTRDCAAAVPVRDELIANADSPAHAARLLGQLWGRGACKFLRLRPRSRSAQPPPPRLDDPDPDEY